MNDKHSTIDVLGGFIDYINKKSGFKIDNYDVINDDKTSVGNSSTGEIFVVVGTGEIDDTKSENNINKKIIEIASSLQSASQGDKTYHGFSDYPVHICSSVQNICPSIDNFIEGKINIIKSLSQDLSNANQLKWTRNNFVGFYKPLHFYKKSWGIYLYCDEIASEANWLLRYVNNNNRIFGKTISINEAVSIVKVFTFFHELYHHKVEALSLKFELLYRFPFYYKGFHCLYCKTYNTEDCLEEAFANASSFFSTLEYFHKNYPSFDKVLLKLIIREALIKFSPPGYNQAYNLVAGTKQEFSRIENHFFDTLLQYSYKYEKGSYLDSNNFDLSFWDIGTYFIDPYINSRNEVTYVVSAGFPVKQYFPNI